MKLAIVMGLGLFIAIPAVLANTPRHPSERAAFVHIHPCPATGRTRGACPGWQVDHVIPLKCDGPDTPENMHWLTVEQHAAKTRQEAMECRKIH